jgi:hypothetical protein
MNATKVATAKYDEDCTYWVGGLFQSPKGSGITITALSNSKWSGLIDPLASRIQRITDSLGLSATLISQGQSFISHMNFQEQLALKLQISLERKEPIGHILCSGPSYLSAFLAGIIARTANSPIFFLHSADVMNPADFIAVLASIDSRQVLYLDELYDISGACFDVLLEALREGKVGIKAGQGDDAHIITVNLPPFTLISSSTKPVYKDWRLKDTFMYHIIVQQVGSVQADMIANSVLQEMYEALDPDYYARLWQNQNEIPILVSAYSLNAELTGEQFRLIGKLWLYQGFAYKAPIDLDPEDILVLIKAAEIHKEKSLSRQRRLVDYSMNVETRRQRQHIPNNIKLFVWQRDGGRCVVCGSNKNLEFDHDIPVSKGGSNTARNIRLLCEVCNRSKRDEIGG